jgi:hypothetical protein
MSSDQPVDTTDTVTAHAKILDAIADGDEFRGRA